MFSEWLNSLRLRLKTLSRRKQLDGDLRDELEFHLAMRAEQNRINGTVGEEAHYGARRALGNTTSLTEVCRDMWTFASFEGVLQDLRFAGRKLRKHPGFTIIAVITLALGIGANAAIFSLIDAVMIKSLPVKNPGELYRLGEGNNCCVIGGLQGNFSIFSYALYQHLKANTPEFSELSAFAGGVDSLSVRREGTTAQAAPYVGEFVAGNYFDTLGVGAYAGRLLNPADDHPNSPPTAVMSYRIWHERYALDPSVIGASFLVNGHAMTIVGVTPPEFFGETLRPDPPDFWVPLSDEPLLQPTASLISHVDQHWLYLIGRLKPAARPEQVQARATVELQQWITSEMHVPDRFKSEISKQHITVTAAGGGIGHLRSAYAPGLRLLAVASGLVLLIACANVANLLLAQGTAHRMQTVLRLALGAPRARLIRQSLTEGLLLGLFGGAAGLAVAYAATQLILALAFRGADYVPIQATPSLLVLGFTALLSLLTSAIFAAAPAWMGSRADAGETLRGTQRSIGQDATLGQKSLVVLQAALSLVLLVGAGLLTASLRNLENQNFGFVTEGRLIVKIDPALAGYTTERLDSLYRTIKERLREIPGVQSVGLSLYSPMSEMNWSSGISVEGRPPSANPADFDGASYLRVSSDYFETIGTPLIRGRFIDSRDTPTSRHIVVINEAFAKKFFSSQDPLGKHFGLGDASHRSDYEIVGIVSDAKYLDAYGAPWPTFFRPLLQMETFKDPADRSVEVRSNTIHDIELHVIGHPQNLQPLIRETLASIDPNLPVLDVFTFGEQVSRNFNQERLISRLAALFGVLALALACIGLYGVLAYSVARRTQEIGIRMALGAARSGILRMVLREALLLAGIGVAIGIPSALGTNQLLSSMLFGLKPTNPIVLTAAMALLLVVAALAAYLPARKASTVDPLVALRYE